ncbi:MAG TPA: hypothetical protein VGR28_12210 [Candidatus Thermoplasmatota archaeon]|jgi:hypothetical protein|nr:hypothetical protein [Candidatus Thermoplasmatota archaeon]
MLHRKSALLAGLVVMGGFGLIGGAEGLAALCDLDRDLPAPVPVLALDQSTLTLQGPLPGDGLASGATPENHPCGGKIRPGVRAVFNNAYLCTLNWIYADSAGALYIGTAGHCAPNLNPLTISAAGVADIGDPAFTLGSGGVGNDFALIKINPAYYDLVDPTLCHWGGPQGMATANTDPTLLHYGWGVDFSSFSQTRPRAGVTQGWGAGSIVFLGAVAPGDSGSPLMMYDAENGQGLAVGVITHTSYVQAPHLGQQYANRVDSGLARANAAQGKGYHVVASSLDPDLTGLTIPE